jgi:hypothetical protein
MESQLPFGLEYTYMYYLLVSYLKDREDDKDMVLIFPVLGGNETRLLILRK